MIPELGAKGKTTEQWEKRREELLQLLGTCEYGVTPEIKLEQVSNVKLLELELADGTYYEAHRLFFRKEDKYCSMRFELIYPKSVKPLPSILMLDMFDTSPDNIDRPETSANLKKNFPFDYLTKQGYAAILVHVNDICNDDCRTFERGIMEIAPRVKGDGWGAIGAWAWGVSRVVDYLMTDERIASDRIAVLGVSRGGKTSLWCGAQDTRIAAVISVVSGCGGASILRGKRGEHIRNMTKVFPYWTCENYAGYAEKEEELPVDQHMLLAVCAPRPLYLSDAIEDEWCDPYKSFEAAVLAGDAYEVYGKDGLVKMEYPEVHEPINLGSIGYHVRTGGHGIMQYDWEQYIRFLNRVWSEKSKG